MFSITCDVSDIADDVSDFEELVGRLAPVCHAVDKYLSALSIEEFTCRYQDMLKWTGMDKVNGEISVIVKLKSKLLLYK